MQFGVPPIYGNPNMGIPGIFNRHINGMAILRKYLAMGIVHGNSNGNQGNNRNFHSEGIPMGY